MAVILIVEDDRDSCEILARYIQRAGHIAHCAHNGREAVHLLSEKDPQLVLLDVSMPEMDGVSFLQVIRSYLRWAQLPVLLITATTDEAMLRRAADLGVKRVFRKADFNLQDVSAAINEELGGA
ncbi:MAG TPA: response regulator [Tepidisphaeraceae bacterium]|jgi:CheY-like chemotaxis protein